MDSKHVQISGMNIIRDVTNMSLINSDKDELQSYINQKNFLIRQKTEINNLKEEIQELKTDISEIKDLLIKNLKG